MNWCWRRLKSCSRGQWTMLRAGEEKSLELSTSTRTTRCPSHSVKASTSPRLSWLSWLFSAETGARAALRPEHRQRHRIGSEFSTLSHGLVGLHESTLKKRCIHFWRCGCLFADTRPSCSVQARTLPRLPAQRVEGEKDTRGSIEHTSAGLPPIHPLTTLRIVE